MNTITITEKAAEQIKKSAFETSADNLPLRIAATRQADNSIHYGMGFDDIGNVDGKDHFFSSHGVDIVIAESSIELLTGTTVDYVELEPNQFHFVFLNPNDPNYQPIEAD